MVAGLLLAWHGPAANAQTVGNTMERWGMFGTWSTDCSRPPDEVGRTAYVLTPTGKVVHYRDFKNAQDSREVLMTALIPDGRLEIFVDFGETGGLRRWVMLKGPDGRIRSVENARIDGTQITVSNGRFLHNGAETPWQSRCSER
jgi:hypothetical protein